MRTASIRTVIILSLLMLIGVAVDAACAESPRPPPMSLDQRCLRDCKAAGTPTQSCMSSCSFVDLSRLPPAPDQWRRQHHQFFSPIPVGRDTVVDPQVLAANGTFAGRGGLPAGMVPSKPIGPSTNYLCINQCLQGGYQYQLCLPRCSR